MYRYFMKPLKKTLTILCLLLMPIGIPNISLGFYEANDLLNAYEYLNELRERADMLPFTEHPLLQTASFNHASYLTTNQLFDHYESPDLPGFTGEWVSDRVIHAGLNNRFVGENLSVGTSNSKEAIDALMSAIYHRFGFLTFEWDIIGIGIDKATDASDAGGTYVFNMGNSDYETLCMGPDFTGFGTYYINICNPDIKIEKNQADALKNTLMAKNPAIVTWPVDGDRDVPPAFFEESPDPLPDYSVSGYPVSVQFNPSADTQVDFVAFQLFNAATNSVVSNTRLLTQATDPNTKFSALEFALFPLERLSWDTPYRAEFTYKDATGTDTVLAFAFQTRDLGIPVFEAQAQGQTLTVPSNQAGHFALYVPPTEGLMAFYGINWQSDSRIQSVDVAFIDNNTLDVKIIGDPGREVLFSFSDTHQLRIKIGEAGEEPTDATDIPPTLVSQITFSTPQTTYQIGQAFVVHLKETSAPRNQPVDLWVALQIGEKLSFINESGQLTLFPAPFIRNLPASQTDFDVFSMTLTAETQGSLVVLGVYTMADSDISKVDQADFFRSDVAVTQVQVE